MRSAREETAVPFLDLSSSTRQVRDRVLAEVADLLDSGAFTNGSQVAAFEVAFARFCGTPHCVGTGSGLDALRFALLAAGISPGDEVIVPANTFVATFEAITQAGGTPVPVDVGLDDYNLDISAAEAAVGERTRFLMPVHLYGQMADALGLLDLAQRRDVVLIEDACQAHGATRDGIGAGSLGAAAAFSFYPGKNLGAFGDAGALVTADEAVAARTRSLREHGQSRKYHHDIEGWTSRLDTIQAIVLLQKLVHLELWNDQRRVAAAAYLDALADVGDLELPQTPTGSTHVWHLFVVQTGVREALAEHLASRGVQTGFHYPQPAHLSGAYAGLGYGAGSFPVTEALAARVLSLPIFPGISDAQLEHVVASVRSFFDDAGK